MSQVLALNAAFQPISWLTPKDAVKCYAENQVLAELGDSVFTFQGGTGRNGRRSIIDANSIIVVKGKVLPYAGQRQFKLPKRGNHALFLRDQYCCAY
ncbi:MAG: HNH endonuclease, partial [Candidatus Nanopelagicales bacterium]